METNYNKVYAGNFLTVQLLVTALEKVGINPIVKDEAESARLAGFGTFNQGMQEIYVHDDNHHKALATIDAAVSEMKS